MIPALPLPWYCAVGGNHINDRKYLEEQAKIILNRITTAQLPLYCIGKTKLGNPYHPAPRVVNRFFGGVHKLKLQEFNFKNQYFLYSLYL